MENALHQEGCTTMGCPVLRRGRWVCRATESKVVRFRDPQCHGNLGTSYRLCNQCWGRVPVNSQKAWPLPKAESLGLTRNHSPTERHDTGMT